MILGLQSELMELKMKQNELVRSLSVKDVKQDAGHKKISSNRSADIDLLAGSKNHRVIAPPE